MLKMDKPEHIKDEVMAFLLEHDTDLDTANGLMSANPEDFRSLPEIANAIAEHMQTGNCDEIGEEIKAIIQQDHYFGWSLPLKGYEELRERLTSQCRVSQKIR